MTDEERLDERILNEVWNEYEDRFVNIWNCPEDKRRYLPIEDFKEALKKIAKKCREEFEKKMKDRVIKTGEFFVDNQAKVLASVLQQEREKEILKNDIEKVKQFEGGQKFEHQKIIGLIKQKIEGLKVCLRKAEEAKPYRGKWSVVGEFQAEIEILEEILNEYSPLKEKTQSDKNEH